MGTRVFNPRTDSSIDHGGISGLSDDDHTQYLLANGNRALTSDWAVGDYQITGIDNLAFTDTAGTIAGIQNQNLLDKSATETISGAYTFTSGVTVDGGTDEIQLLVQGNSTQSNYLATMEQSDGTDVLTVSNVGETIIGTGATSDSSLSLYNGASLGAMIGWDYSASKLVVSLGVMDTTNDEIRVDSNGVTVVNGLIIPSGTTPAPAVEGALFLDTDASANGDLVMYANGAWRTVATL